MGTETQAIEQAGADALKALKKIIASKGKLQGNFYYAGDSTGKTAGLVITLTSRDPKGGKAATQGKALRKALTGAKFGRGVVTVDGTKLSFELRSGSTSGGQMKNGFKKGFGGDKLKALKAFLRKATIKAPDGAEEAAEESGGVDAASIFSGMSEAAAAALKRELGELVELQGDLSRRNEELNRSFLSAAAAEADELEMISDLKGEIFKLEAASPIDEEAVAEKRQVLAGLTPSGLPLPEVGAPISQDLSAMLSTVQSSELATVSATPPASFSDAAATYRDAMDTVQSQLEKLRQVLAASGDDDLIQIGEQGLPRLTANRKTPLEAALMEAKMSSGDKQAVAITKISDLATAFADQLAGNPATAATDNNPYGVAVSIESVLVVALRGLALSARPS